jgi:hypothetical protein
MIFKNTCIDPDRFCLCQNAPFFEYKAAVPDCSRSGVYVLTEIFYSPSMRPGHPVNPVPDI